MTRHIWPTNCYYVLKSLKESLKRERNVKVRNKPPHRTRQHWTVGIHIYSKVRENIKKLDAPVAKLMER